MLISNIVSCEINNHNKTSRIAGKRNVNQQRNIKKFLSTAMYEEDLFLRYSLELKLCLSYISSDGSQIAKLLLYMFAKFGRFLIDYGMVYQVLSPIFEQGDKKFYPNDPLQPGTTFPIGLDPSKPFHRYKGLGAFNKDQIYDIFYNPVTRKLVQVTPEGMDYAMKLTENVDERKNLLVGAGIISNPYGFTDL